MQILPLKNPLIYIVRVFLTHPGENGGSVFFSGGIRIKVGLCSLL
jgi:hypothetical protein